MKHILIFLLLGWALVQPACAQESDIDTKLEKMAAQLSERIRTAGKNRVAVVDFTDLQSNVTELGKYVAENFQGALVNNQMRVINRTRLSQLLLENQLTAQGLLDPANALKIGKAAGIEVIIIGSLTPIDDRNIDVIVQAIDVQGAETIASAKTSLVRTASLNDLLRSNVKAGGGETVIQRKPIITDSENIQDVREALMGDKSFTMKIGDCYDRHGINNYGQICFENSLKTPLNIYKMNNPAGSPELSIFIGSGARNCGGKLWTGANTTQVFKFTSSENYTFYFHTAEPNEEDRLYGRMDVVVEGCKVITRVINENRLFLSKKKPD
jgi:hypothetical protein